MITLLHRQPTYTLNIKPPFWEISEYLKGNESILFDIVGNVIMLLPLGILVPIWIRKADSLKKVALTGCFISVFIEIIQLITTRGFFEIDDIVHNTLGTLIGALIGCPLARWLYSQQENIPPSDT